MPINPNAAIEITAFRWVPPSRPGPGPGPARPLGARGGRARLSGPADRRRAAGRLSARISRSTRCRASATATVQIFESGAILQYIGEKSEALLPRDPQGKYRAIQWTYAALNSVEPFVSASARCSTSSTPTRSGRSCAKPTRRRFRAAEAAAAVRLARRQAVARRRPLHHRRPDDGHGPQASPTAAGMLADFPNLAAYREARRSAAGVPAGARRPARRIPRTPTGRSSSMTYFEGFHRARSRRQTRTPTSSMRSELRADRSRSSGVAAAWSKPGTVTFPKARSPTSARRSTPSRTRRSSSPGSNIPTQGRATPPTRS